MFLFISQFSKVTKHMDLDPHQTLQSSMLSIQQCPTPTTYLIAFMIHIQLDSSQFSSVDLKTAITAENEFDIDNFETQLVILHHEVKKFNFVQMAPREVLLSRNKCKYVKLHAMRGKCNIII